MCLACIQMYSSMIALVVFQTLFLSIFTLKYKKAAKVNMWMDALPAMAAEVAAPLSQTNKITMVCNTNEDASLGPSRVTNEVLNIMEKIPSTVTTMTGYNVKSHL